MRTVRNTNDQQLYDAFTTDTCPGKLPAKTTQYLGLLLTNMKKPSLQRKKTNIEETN